MGDGVLGAATGRRSGLALTEAAGEFPRERDGGGGGGLFMLELVFKSDEEAAVRRARALMGELDRWSLLDIARGRGLPGSGARRSVLGENLWTAMVGDDSTANFSNFDRRLLTAGVGVSSTSGGESESMARVTSGDHQDYTALYCAEMKRVCYSSSRREARIEPIQILEERERKSFEEKQRPAETRPGKTCKLFKPRPRQAPKILPPPRV